MSSSSEAASGTNGKASASASASHRGQGAIMLMKELKGARATAPATVSRTAGYRGSHGRHPYPESPMPPPARRSEKEPRRGLLGWAPRRVEPIHLGHLHHGPPRQPIVSGIAQDTPSSSLRALHAWHALCAD